MKNIRKTGAGLLLMMILVGAFTGCSDFLDLLALPLTIDQRVLAFNNALNSETRSASNILANFGPEDSMAYYDSAKVLTYWEAAFPAAYQYTFVITDKTDPDAVVVAGTIKDADGNLIEATVYTFKMSVEATGNYLIQEIYEEGVTDALIRRIDF